MWMERGIGSACCASQGTPRLSRSRHASYVMKGVSPVLSVHHFVIAARRDTTYKALVVRGVWMGVRSAVKALVVRGVWMGSIVAVLRKQLESA